MMKVNKFWKWVSFIMVLAILDSCGVDIPKEKQSSFETMTVQKADIEVPMNSWTTARPATWRCSRPRNPS